MAKTYLTNEQKQLICKLHREGQKVSAISEKLGINRASIYYTINKNLANVAYAEMPLPSGYTSGLDAFVDYKICVRQGLDSPETIALCRSLGTKLSELKEYGEWASHNLAVVDKNFVKAHHEEVASLNQKISQITTLHERDTLALAEFGKEVLLYKSQLTAADKENEQLQLEKDLLKKAKAIFLG